jgi:uncharacterized Zn-finger protein
LQDCEAVRHSSCKSFLCPYCSAGFLHQGKLTRHILSHSLPPLKYRESTSHLYTPLTSTSSASNEPLSFDVKYRPGSKSGLPLPSPSLLQDADKLSIKLDAPQSAVDATEGSAVVCKFCGETFPDVSALVTHLPAHTGERPFKCSFCGKAFKLRHHMRDHCRVHTGERPFRCTLCGKTFSRSTILKAHEKTHYPAKYRRNKGFPSSPISEELPQPEHRNAFQLYNQTQSRPQDDTLNQEIRKCPP